MDERTAPSLQEALSVVKLQSSLMMRNLDSESLMDALKAASTMLAELRTSSLSPKQYYELYMAVFDALGQLSSFLYDAHTSGKHHLADLYELVQYAGNIVPRLYLMISVGTVYMSIPEAPIQEIMKDMMEMTRGVQHPIRGLFLRHYLSGMTKDHLPIGDVDGPGGNLKDSIGFVLTNLIEMNKLWVRLQHQGLSRDREKREMERKELRILVGTNLVRLSQLEGVNLEMYRTVILPSILEQVVNCKDVIAQEYLMEIIIQVFTDDFHLRTLGPFLSATAQLHPKVNIKQIVIALIDRLAAYAAREAENEIESAAAAEVQPAAESQANGEKTVEVGAAEDTPDSPATPTMEEKQVASYEEKPAPTVKKYRGIPEDVKLFEVFWHQVTQLVKARPDLSIQDITALLVSLVNLSLSCYPERLEYVGQVLEFAAQKTAEYQDSPDLHHPTTTSHLLSLLLAPISSYPTVLTLLSLPYYNDLLKCQPFSTRRAIAHAVVSSVLKNETLIATSEHVSAVLELCHVLVRDQRDAGAPSRPANSRTLSMRTSHGIDSEEVAEEQGWIARMIHLFYADDLDTQYQLLVAARTVFQSSETGERIKYTLPPLIASAIHLTRRYKYREHFLQDFEQKLDQLFRFIHQVTSQLYNKVDSSSEICLRLNLLALQAADDAKVEGLAYEFAVQAFTVYEESISDSKAQLQAITLIISALQQTRVFGTDNFDTLITKAALHGAKLLKKGHQATAVALASHLWWQTPIAGKDEDETKLFRDGKRVLECLQKSLRIATACIDDLTTVELYVSALEQYLYYFERGVEEVSAKHINSLVELIMTNIDKIHAFDFGANTPGAASGLIEGAGHPDAVLRHFQSILASMASKRQSDEDGWAEITIQGALLKYGMPAQ